MIMTIVRAMLLQLIIIVGDIETIIATRFYAK